MKINHTGREYKEVIDKELIESYQSTGSVWKTGEQVGLSGQTVHYRLTKLNVCKKMNFWSEKEDEILKSLYVEYKSKGELQKLSDRLGRTKQFICRQAKRLGLTGYNPNEWMKDKHDLLSQKAKERIVIHGHPKGYLGHKHSEEARRKISVSSNKAWSNPTHFLNSDEHRQNLSDRMSILQSEGKLTNNYSRVNSGTVIIGGKTHFYRSSWEVNIAAYFEFLKSKNEIKDWEYEPHTFWFEPIKRGVRSYKPDFRITKNDDSQYYVEVKGWMDDKSRTKLRRMGKYHPKIEIEVIDQSRYYAIKKNSSIIPEWGLLERGGGIEFKRCSVDGCENKVHSKNLCRKHFYKIYRK